MDFCVCVCVWRRGEALRRRLEEIFVPEAPMLRNLR